MIHKTRNKCSDETLNKIILGQKIKLQIENRRKGFAIVKYYPSDGKKPYKVLVATFKKTNDNRYIRTYSARGFKNMIFDTLEDIKAWYGIE